MRFRPALDLDLESHLDNDVDRDVRSRVEDTVHDATNRDPQRSGRCHTTLRCGAALPCHASGTRAIHRAGRVRRIDAGSLRRGGNSDAAKVETVGDARPSGLRLTTFGPEPRLERGRGSTRPAVANTIAWGTVRTRPDRSRLTEINSW